MDKIIRYETQIQLVPSSMKQLNRQFALVDILLCYHGKNRNRTSMSKEVIEAALPSLYGIPIVGEYIYLNDGSQDFGSHGGKIILSDKGIEFEDTTKPYGFITKDAVDNAKWVTITEKDGHTRHEYLELKSCIIWQERYDEVSALLDKNYGQSMEIEINKGHYDNDDYFVIEDLTFSAACILGSNPDGTGVEPCFESACIGRHYELDSFKKEFSLMLDEYRKINKMEDNKIMTEKVFELLSAVTFKCNNADVAKYIVLSVTDTEANVIDREDGYKAYSIPYTVTESANPEEGSDLKEVVFDYDGKAEKSISVMDKVENDFSIQEEINTASNAAISNAVTSALATYESTAVQEITNKYSDLEGKYNQLKSDYESAKSKLDVFESEKKDAEQKLHMKEIDDVVESYAAKMGTYADYLLYRGKIDYSKTKEQVNTDMLILLGKANLGQKSTFSFNPVITGIQHDTSFESDNGNGRYGDLFDKVKK